MKSEMIYGVHAVKARLQQDPESILQLFVQKGSEKRLHEVIKLANANKVRVVSVSRDHLGDLVQHKHQGVAAECGLSQVSTAFNDFDEMLKVIPDNATILVLDGVQDPHNLGACLRSANAAGALAVIAPKDKAVGLTPVVRKVACGAAESTPFLTVVNLSRALKQLQEAGVWVYGLAGEAKDSLHSTKFSGKVALVMGAEGAGLRRLTRESCDLLLKIPMVGDVESLNVSVATGVCLFEVLRQR